MSENNRDIESLSEMKAQKAAEKLNAQIEAETKKFNEKIRKLGEKAGLTLETEVSIIFK